jgi:hypothetical protein
MISVTVTPSFSSSSTTSPRDQPVVHINVDRLPDTAIEFQHRSGGKSGRSQRPCEFD